MTQRTAIVTGGLRGIGAGITAALADAGMRVVATGRKEPSQLTDEARVLLDHPEVRYVVSDIASAEDRRDLVAAARDESGSIDVLVNNAGITSPRRIDPLELDVEDFDRVIDVNLRGTHFLTQAVARSMVGATHDRGGTIVTITSISAAVVSTDRSDYCIAKAGSSMSTRIWAERLAPHGISVFEVRPGLVRTDMTAPAAAKYDRLIEDGLVPTGRWGEPADVGRAVASLATGALPYTTGQVITIDGGLTIPRL